MTRGEHLPLDRRQVLWIRGGEAIIIGVLSALGAQQTTKPELQSLITEVRALSLKVYTLETELAALKRDLHDHDRKAPSTQMR